MCGRVIPFLSEDARHPLVGDGVRHAAAACGRLRRRARRHHDPKLDALRLPSATQANPPTSHHAKGHARPIPQCSSECEKQTALNSPYSTDQRPVRPRWESDPCKADQADFGSSWLPLDLPLLALPRRRLEVLTPRTGVRDVITGFGGSSVRGSSFPMVTSRAESSCAEGVMDFYDTD